PQNGVSSLRDPFPIRANGTRYDVPTRDGLGPMARVGRGWTYTDFDTRRARQQRWRAGLQRQLGSNMVIEVAYAGSYSDRVRLQQRIDYLPERYFADGLVRNAANQSNLDSNVTNPFNIRNLESLRASHPLIYQDLTTQGFFTSATIRKNQLLRPFPHMNGLNDRAVPIGEVRTHSIEVQFERRFSRGYSFNAGYTGLRQREADYFPNEYDRAPAYRESNDTRPQRFIATSIYELPFGKGRAFARGGLPGAIAGGWQIAVTYEAQPGPLIDWGNRFFYGNLDDINTGVRTLDRWFNTDGFERNASRGPTGPHKRVFPTRIGDLRRDMTSQWNANIQRDFKFTEGLSLQLRLDALNLQNRSQFNAPNADPFSTAFGRVESQTSATNRFIQIQGRIRF
ncbi:MAG: hypothetical protein ACRD96_22120, partial [Bryobacteraceae bacterium]